jgi:ferritin
MSTMTEVPERLRELCNEQIVNELHASHLYLSMAAYLNERGLYGCAEFMREQSEEEREHAMKFYDHLVERDARVDIGALDDTPSDWDSVQGIFRDAYQHEQKVTQQIETIYDAAEEEGDRPLETMLDWFVDEQVEEERTFRRILELFDFIDDDPTGLLEIDERLDERGEE